MNRDSYLASIRFPVTREQLVNGLLVGKTDRGTLALFERLPRRSYESSAQLEADIAELSRLDAGEAEGASSFAALLDVVVRNAGDVDHVTKDGWNALVDAVIEGAGVEDAGGERLAEDFRERLRAAYVDFRHPMSETFDYSAPRDPELDRPESATP